MKANSGGVQTGSALEKYKKYITGETKPVYTHDPTSNPDSLVPIILSPFAAVQGALYRTAMSKRAQAALETIVNTPATVFSHLELAGQEVAVTAINYVPAKAICQMSSTGSEPEPSKITGVSYKKELGRKSYTVPFGEPKTRSATTGYLKSMQTIREAALTKVPSGETSVSFKPEHFRG